MKKLGVGIIGTGWGVKVQVHSFRESQGWNVVALCARDEKKLENFAKELSIPFYTTSIEELTKREDVDLIVVTVPPHLHKEIAIQCLKAGKNVLCDKPMCLNRQESLEMIECGKNHPNQLQLIDFELRQISSYQKAKNYIQQNKLGTILSVHGNFISHCISSRTFSWWHESDKGGGLLGAVGSHWIDYTSWLINSHIAIIDAKVHTFIKQRKDSEGKLQQVTSDDAFDARFKFENGVEGFFNFTQCAQGPAIKDIRVIGTEGTLVLDVAGEDGIVKVYDSSGKQVELWQNELKLKEGSTVPTHIWGKGTVIIAQSIAKCLEAKDFGNLAKYELADFKRGLYVQSVLDAMRASSGSSSPHKVELK